MEIPITEAAILMTCWAIMGFFVGRYVEIDTALEDKVKPKDRHIKTEQEWMEGTDCKKKIASLVETMNSLEMDVGHLKSRNIKNRS